MLGISDIIGAVDSGYTDWEDLAAVFSEENVEVWFWCRYHVKAEQITDDPSEPCDGGSNCEYKNHAGIPVSFEHTHDVCVRIGPFMSDDEANRLDQRYDHQGWPLRRALGMEVGG